MKNYATFNQLPSEAVALAQIVESSAGIEGWVAFGGWGFWSGSVRWGEGFEGGIGSRNQLFLGTALRSKLTATRIRLTEG